MKNKKIISLLIIPMFTLLISCEKQPVLYLAGDSTMADKDIDKAPETGWGQVLPDFFNESIRIENHARNGRSTRSFRYEGRWDSLLNKVRKGDYVIIQFGHNDESESKVGRHSTPEEYAYNLRGYILDVQSRQATPILCTPVVRRRFDEQGQFYESHGVYPDIVRDLAKEFQIPLLDMQKGSKALLIELGPERSKEVYLHLQPGDSPNYPDGREDNTHFNVQGARRMAEIAVEEIRELDIYLKNHLR